MQNTIRYATGPSLALSIRQQLERRRTTELPGGTALWWAAAKATLIVVGCALALHLWLGSAIEQVNLANQAVMSKKQQLRDQQIALLAERASLMSKKQVEKEAGQKLALYVPEQEQVYKLR